MKTTPTLLRPDMARAWDDGRKCRTQRLITRLNGFGPITDFGRFRDKRMMWNELTTDELMKACPYGVPGDRLRLLTTWGVWPQYDKVKPRDLKVNDSQIWSYFDGPEKPYWIGKLRHGRFMPQWIRDMMPAPKIISIEPRRIQEITDNECLEEGIKPRDVAARGYQDARVAFRVLWDSIHPPILKSPPFRPGHPWLSNPWVWNIRFQKRGEM